MPLHDCYAKIGHVTRRIAIYLTQYLCYYLIYALVTVTSCRYFYITNYGRRLRYFIINMETIIKYNSILLLIGKLLLTSIIKYNSILLLIGKLLLTSIIKYKSILLLIWKILLTSIIKYNSSNNSLMLSNNVNNKLTKNYNKICFFSLLRNIEIDGELRIDIGSLFHTEAADILKDLLVICNRHLASSSCMG